MTKQQLRGEVETAWKVIEVLGIAFALLLGIVIELVIGGCAVALTGEIPVPFPPLNPGDVTCPPKQ